MGMAERRETAPVGGRAKSSASPYHALPGSASALGVQVARRPRTAHVTAPPSAASNAHGDGGGDGGGARSVYARAPRPPVAMRDFVPLRPRTASASHEGRAAAMLSSTQDERDRLRPMSARIAVGTIQPMRMVPPMSARGRMQNAGSQAETGDEVVPAVSRLSSEGYLHDNAVCEGCSSENKHGQDDIDFVLNWALAADVLADHAEVAIFPEANRNGFIPPAPVMQQPNPRRRPISARARASSVDQDKGSRMPAAVTNGLGGDGEGGIGLRLRSALLHDLGPAMVAIASLTHETSLGKLARQVDAVALVLLEADASRLTLYSEMHNTLHVVKPGEPEHNTAASVNEEFAAQGITGLVAQSGMLVNAPNLYENKDAKIDVDLGLSHLPEKQHITYLSVPARDKAGKVVGVISVMRMGTQDSFDEDAEKVLEMIASQAGIAISLCLERRSLLRTKTHSKILNKAAVELTSAEPLDAPSLTMLASVYAKQLGDCDSVVVGLLHERRRYLRTWAMHPSESLEDDTTLQERSHILVPTPLKKTVATGSVANLLLHGSPVNSSTDELAYLNDPELKICSVIDGQTLEYTRNSDSCLAVPLQTEAGTQVFGLIVAINKFGGPRRAGQNGVFTPVDEEALRELAFIVSAAFVKVMRIKDLEQVIALAPALTQHTNPAAALTDVSNKAAEPFKADRLFIFTLEEDGAFHLHQPESGAAHKRGGSLVGRNGKLVDPSPVRLWASSHPMNVALESSSSLRVRVKDVSDLIVSKKSGLMSHATDMIACAIRDTDGNVYGIMIAATLGQHTFPEYSLQLFSDVSAQMGAVLRKCGHFKEKTNHVRALKHASKEMLDIVNERELKNVLDHINNRVSSFMCCSRAVLYIVDRRQHVIWTVVKDSEDESIITYEIKTDLNPNTEGSRVGYVNVVLHDGKTVVVKDFAYGQHAYNDMLDGVDIKHVQTLYRLNSGAYDSSTTAIMRAELEDPAQHTESIAAMPVYGADGEIVAVLQVMNRWKSASVKKVRKEGFDADDLDKLELVAAAVSSSLETAARLNRHWEREHELRAIIDSANHGTKIGMGATCRVNLNDALSYVAKQAYAKCGASQVAVYLLDDEGRMDIIRFEGNLFVPCGRVKADIKGLAGETMRKDTKLNLPDARQHPAFNSLVDEKELLPAASVLTCSIKDPNGKIVGALVFQNKKATARSQHSNDTDPFRAHGTHSARKAVMVQGHDTGWQPFDKCDERVLEAAAQGVGVALTQFVLFDSISNVTERLKDISRELELDRACEQISVACRQLCKARHCHVFLLDDKTGDMLCTHKQDLLRVPCNYGIPGAVRKRGGAIFHNDTLSLRDLVDEQRVHSSDASNSQFGIHAGSGRTYDLDQYNRECTGLWNCMGVPMLDANGRIVGVLEIGDKIGRLPFTSQDERLIRIIASHAHTTIKHCITYDSILDKAERRKEILSQVVGLTKRVAATFTESFEYSSAYRDIVEATCEVMGAVGGHVYVDAQYIYGNAGSHRQWMSYDRYGKQVKERSTQTGARVMESGTLINNTRLPITMSSDADAPPDTGDEDLKDARVMCAPISITDPDKKEGTVVIGALEVEAEVGHEFRVHEEELLEVMAGATSAVLEIMRLIRVGDKDSKKGIGVLPPNKDQTTPSTSPLKR